MILESTLFSAGCRRSCMRSFSAGSQERFNYNTGSVFADIPRMTQLLHMLRLNSLLAFFFFLLCLFLFNSPTHTHMHKHTHAAVAPTRHRPLQVLACTLCWVPSAATANAFFSDDKHRVKVSEPSVHPSVRPSVRLLLPALYSHQITAAAPRAFVLVTQLTGFFKLFLPSFSLSFFLLCCSVHPLTSSSWRNFRQISDQVYGFVVLSCSTPSSFPPFYVNSFFSPHSASSVAAISSSPSQLK